MSQQALPHYSPGKIVVCTDDWPTSDNGFGYNPTSTNAYVSDILSWFKPGGGGRFLLSSRFPYNSSFQAVMAKFGSCDRPSTLPSDLTPYDAVFLYVDNPGTSLLQSYVDNGGCVYIALGAGYSLSTWGDFLAPYGIVPGSQDIHYSVNQAPITPGQETLLNLSDVSSLTIWGPTPLSLAANAPSGTVVAATYAGTSNIAVVASEPKKVDVFDDGVIRVTHTFYNTVKENTVVTNNTIEVENLTSMLTLTDVALSVQVNTHDANWDAFTCNGNGDFQKIRNATVGTGTLAPGASGSLNYNYRTSLTGASAPENFTVNIDILPSYSIDYSNDRAVVSPAVVKASGTASANGAIQTAADFQDVDGVIKISDFKYVPTIAETSDQILVGGTSTTFTCTLLVEVKNAVISVGVNPKADSSEMFWEVDSADASGNDVHPAPWYPNVQMLSKDGSMSAQFQYQYNLEADVDASMKSDFGIQLDVLPRIHIFYTTADAFQSQATAKP